MPQTLFLLPVRNQPRYRKRIEGLQRAGIDAWVAYFDRPYFMGGNWPEVGICLGRLAHGSYLARGHTLAKALPRVRSALRQVDCVYAFGSDMALLARLANIGIGRPLIYELGDIRDLQLAQGTAGALLRWLDRRIAVVAREVVVTAPGFADGYFHDRLGVESDRIRVIENRLDLPAGARPEGGEENSSEPVVVGYFGVLRCQRSWEVLKRVAEAAAGRIRVDMYGYPLGIDIESGSGGPSGVRYLGEYQSPDDLASMYASVDIVWGCYPAPDSKDAPGNWRWARTNRFYESCYFRRPLIALAGSDEGQIVEDWDIGFTVDLSDVDTAAERVLAMLDKNNLQHWRQRVAAVPDDVCVYTDEHERLAEALKRYVGIK